MMDFYFILHAAFVMSLPALAIDLDATTATATAPKT